MLIQASHITFDFATQNHRTGGFKPDLAGGIKVVSSVLLCLPLFLGALQEMKLDDKKKDGPSCARVHRRGG